MTDKYFDRIIHGGDYNPDQWIDTPEIWDEDMRLMKLAHINSATVGIFAWSLLEPEEGRYNFGWLDEIMDKCAENNISVILSTPSGARPPWLSQKYPEVLRVEENGIRNEFGVRENHCLTSPVYRQKVREINRKLAERYKDHPALKMWHISNEYCGECHCELCQAAFRSWLREYYHNDIEELNSKWWNGFWSHRFNDFDQISSPKERGENHVSAQKQAWQRFVTDSHISFFDNEVAPLREITPDIPVTTNFMAIYSGIDYQRFAPHVDLISWDSYPDWGTGDDSDMACVTAFTHDLYRSMKGGKPFFLMESTPSIANWKPVNRIPTPGTQQLAAMQAVSMGADSVQYFQWRKARGGHEKYHGAVVDHCGHENTRVFREITETGKTLEKLSAVVGERIDAKTAIIFDWENMWHIKHYSGFNNEKRDYAAECQKWYAPFYRAGVPVDVISMDSDFSKYDVIVAPWLYMLKDGTEEAIEKFVREGGTFVATYMFGMVDSDDRCFLGGFPANGLKKVFGIRAEETDSLPEGEKGKASFGGKEYSVETICDIIHTDGADVLGRYESEFYCGEPAVTVNKYGKGKAYICAFRNEGDFTKDFVNTLVGEEDLKSDAPVALPEGVFAKRRGRYLFLLNFGMGEAAINLDKGYYDVMNEKACTGRLTLKKRGFAVLESRV